ncbi:MAG: four-carbon acid sugar kinase family protein [Rikenellaceae bacterium]|nr:four-carbon acid sugar kinase family protein [Rikenellaceae bacterium]
MIAVIADDITGAAEIAGIGLRFGLRVEMVVNSDGKVPDADLLVYATDTRSLPLAEAVMDTRRVMGQLNRIGYRALFKKVDSALRGHVVPEIEVVQRATGIPRTRYLPQNPSKGRVIRGGNYYINGQPLDRTLFAEDPEFPARTANLSERFPRIQTVLTAADALKSSGIQAANAESDAEIARFVRQADEKTVLAGGADLFTAWLRELGWRERTLPEFPGLGLRDAIIVCGSTAQHSLAEYDYFRRKLIPVEDMPMEVFELQRDPKAWFAGLAEIYELHHSIAVAVGDKPRKDRCYAVRLRNIMAAAVSALTEIRLPHELVIEGGATAFSVLAMLGWSCFRVTDELAPGVVRMVLQGASGDCLIPDNREIHITLKPGSYPWGDRIFS